MNLWQGLAAAGVGLLKGQNIVQERKRAEKERQEDKNERAKREAKAAAVDQLRVYDNSITALANNGEFDKAREVLQQRNALADEHKLPQLPEDLTKPNRRLQYDDWLKFKNQFGNTQDGYKAAKRAFGGLWGEEEADEWFPEIPAPQTVQPNVGMAGKFLPPSRPGQGLLPIPKADATPTPVPSAQATPQAPAPNFNPFLEELLKALPRGAPAPAPSAVMGATNGSVPPPVTAPTPTFPAPAPIAPQVGVAGATAPPMRWAPQSATFAPQNPLAQAAIDAWKMPTPQERLLAQEQDRQDAILGKSFRTDLALKGPGMGYTTDVMQAVQAFVNGEPLTPEQESALNSLAAVKTDYMSALTGLHETRAAKTAMETKYIPEEYKLEAEKLRLSAQTARDRTSHDKAMEAIARHNIEVRRILGDKALKLRSLQGDQKEIGRLERLAHDYNALAFAASQWEGAEGYENDFRGYANDILAQTPAPRATGAPAQAARTSPAGRAGKETDKDFCVRIYQNAPDGLRKEMDRSTLSLKDLANWLRKQGCK